MIPADLSVLAVMEALLVATVGIGLTGALLAWRERPEPGAVSLTLLMGGQCWWSATQIFRIDATSMSEQIFWMDLSWLGVVIVPVGWLLFSLSYTGRSDYLRPRYIAAVSAVPLLCGLLGATNEFHNLFYVESTLVEVSGRMLVERTPGPGFWVIAGYTYLLGLLGAIPLLQFVTSDLGVFKAQSVALLVGLFAPWLTNILSLLGVFPTGPVDVTPIAFSVTGLAYLGALTRFQLFGTSPAPIYPARRSVFRRMQAGALVLDRHDNIVDINARAVEQLRVTPNEALGQPVTTAIPEFHEITDTQSESSRAILESDSGIRALEVSVNRLRDVHDRTTGLIVTLHDITEYYRQQQRLEVLNRVFRHNIRSNTQVIIGNADYLARESSESKATTVQEKALEIDDISDQIRKILDIFEQGRAQPNPKPVEAVLGDCIHTVREAYPEVTIESDFGSRAVEIDSLLREVFLNLIENAARHNTNSDPRVRIEVTAGAERVQVVIEDNGPGIDDEELALVTDGKETPLKHGTGFGLALAVWGVDVADGEISFTDNEPTGTVVTVTVPILSSAGDDRGPGGVLNIDQNDLFAQDD
ncbi:MAG: histidine kinase N-terminal 7TM domain-containing protein [Halovenus sp.]